MIFAFDLDGVIYAGEVLLAGAVEAVTMARALGHSTYFITNNSRQTPVELSVRLQSMGLDAAPREIVSAVDSAGLLVSRINGSPDSAMVIGSEALRQVIENAGVRAYSYEEPGPFDVLVIGLDFGINYQKLLAAHRVLEQPNVHFVAVNNDATFGSEGGSVPGLGAIVSAVASAAGRGPDIVAGKPEPHMFNRILELEGVEAGDLVVFGDSLYSDVGGAKAIGAKTALVLTGVDGREDVASAPPERSPDWIIESLENILFDEIAESRS
ncbi:MAG: HAD-IIA family hydrolase [Gammaproteobacteria bacterium]|nr:HAD-IIA family hydrolase [Gammaproteobacteria bacterium]